VRVISGIYGKRIFDAPRGKRTHPMGDKIRGALFNALGDIEGLSVLDAYSGSGALSIEASSRGASRVVAVENDKKAVAVIQENLEKLGVENVTLEQANVITWSKNNQHEQFDIVFCDPPYTDVRPDVLAHIADHCYIGGVVMFSLPTSLLFTMRAKHFKPLASKTYGDATLVFYRRTK
jgi:16S rRNA (guanine966-N2)-methyltransferase